MIPGEAWGVGAYMMAQGIGQTKRSKAKKPKMDEAGLAGCAGVADDVMERNG